MAVVDKKYVIKNSGKQNGGGLAQERNGRGNCERQIVGRGFACIFPK